MAIKELYCCWNYHHILVAAILSMKKNKNADIVLIQKYNSIDNSVIENLKRMELFENTYIFEEEKVGFAKRRNFVAYLYNRYFKLKSYYNRYFPVNITNYSDIFIFVDFDSVAPYLMLKKVKFHLIEDAKNVFSQDTFNKNPAASRKKYIYPSGFTKILEKMGVIFPIYGNSKYCLDISVNNLDNLIKTENNCHKFVQLPEKELLSSIDENGVNTLYDIFGRNFKPDELTTYSIVITEPLFEDKRLDSFEKQLKCYKSIIDHYCENVHIIIKPHPRDNCDYSSLKSESVTVITKAFPSELLSLIPLNQVQKFITVSSSAIFTYPENKQLMLGEDFLKSF